MGKTKDVALASAAAVIASVITTEDSVLGKRKADSKDDGSSSSSEPAKKLSTFEMAAKQRAEKAVMKKEEKKHYSQLSMFQAQLWADTIINSPAAKIKPKDGEAAEDDDVKIIEIINVDPFAYADDSNMEHADPVAKGGMQNLNVPLIVTAEIKKSKNDALDYYTFLCSVPVLDCEIVPGLDGVGEMIDVEAMKYPVLQIFQHSKIPLKNGQTKWTPNPLLDPQQFFPGQQICICVDCKDGTTYSNLKTIAGSIFMAEGLKPCDNGRINAKDFKLVSSIQDNGIYHYRDLIKYFPRDYVWLNNLREAPPKKEAGVAAAPVVVPVQPPVAEAKKESGEENLSAPAPAPVAALTPQEIAAQKAEEDKAKAVQEMAAKAKKASYQLKLNNYKDALPLDLQLVHAYPFFLQFGISNPLETIDPSRGFLQQYMDFENTKWTWTKKINDVEVFYPALEFDIIGKQWNEELLVPFDKPEKVFIKTKIWNPENILGISMDDCWTAIAPVALKAQLPPGMMFAKSKLDESYFLQTPAAYASRLRADVALSMEVNDVAFPMEGLLSYYAWPLNNDAAVAFIENLMKKRGVEDELSFAFNGSDFLPETRKKISKDCQQLFTEQHPSIDNLLETSRGRFMLMTTAMLGKKSNPQICVLAPHLLTYDIRQKLKKDHNIDPDRMADLPALKDFVSAAFDEPTGDQAKGLGIDQWTESDWKCCVPYTIGHQVFETSFSFVHTWVEQVKDKLLDYISIAKEVKKEREELEKEREEEEKQRQQEEEEEGEQSKTANGNGDSIHVTDSSSNGYGTQDPGEEEEEEGEESQEEEEEEGEGEDSEAEK